VSWSRHGAEASLHDAVRIPGLIRDHGPEAFEKEAVWWMERYARERARTVDHLDPAVAALDLVRADPGVAVTLAQLVR
jgi:hypothetical protein